MEKLERPTVLLIDSDPNHQKTIADLLVANGYATLAAASGAEGLALLGTRAIAVALIDLGVPDIPGLDLLSTVTTDHPTTAALVVTGNANLESAIEAINRGAVSYLVKPCETGQLMDQIRRAIDKQRAVAALHRSESLFRGLLESAPEAVLIVDGRYRIQMVNRQFEAMFGYDRTEVVGREIEMLIPGRYVRHRDLSRGYIHNPKLRHMGKSGDFHALKKDGSELPVEIALSPLTIPDGLIVFATIRDVSERKQAEAAHRRHLHFLESMELINQAIRQETDVELMLQNVVKTVLPMFGCDRVWLFYPCDPDAPSFRVPVETSRPEYPGANTLDVEVPMSPSLADDLRKALTSDDPLIFTLGQEKSVNDSAKQFAVQSQMFQAIYPKTGKPWAFGMHQCSHPRLWTEEEKALFKEIGRRVADGLSSVLFLRDLRESEERLRQKIVELQAAQEELVRKEKLAILGLLAGSVGHELRNPLGVMSNAVYFLKMVLEEADETVQEYLGIIKKEIDTSLRIITDLLDFARTKPPKLQTVTARAIIDESLGRCTLPNNVELDDEVPATIPPLKVDPLQIGQVLQNLITNGVQAMPAGGTLSLRGSREDVDTVRLEIADTGEGISPENIKKLFQPLFTTKARGIGLGLVVCRNLTETHGGRIEVRSEPGKGTVFAVLLPVAGGGARSDSGEKSSLP